MSSSAIKSHDIDGTAKDPRELQRLNDSLQIVVTKNTGKTPNEPIPATTNGAIPQASNNIKNILKNYVEKGKLYEDPDFPANRSSIFYSADKNIDNLVWMRPKEMCDNPQFIMDGSSRFDVKQGMVADCWFLATVASLALMPDLIEKVVPKNQSFTKEYCGAFRFNFWHEGEWREVIVDDRLPTVNKRLIYVSSSSPQEFWSALLEKAYAKLKGNYETICWGQMAESMIDLTGGLSEGFELGAAAPENLADILAKATTKRSVISCSIDKPAGATAEVEKKTGLFGGHAYSITGFAKDLKDNKNNKVNLIRIRNPWGTAAEWNGAWRDNAPEWNTLSDSQKREIGVEFKADGEFWMSLADFIQQFNWLQICHLNVQMLGLDGEKGAHEDHSWQVVSINDAWKARVNAGGWRNFKKTYWTNPQYKISVRPDEHSAEKLGTIIIGLMVKNHRRKRLTNTKNPSFGYIIWGLKEPNAPIDENFFSKQERTFMSSVTSSNQTMGRHELPKGEYIIVPATVNPDEEAEFLLRIFFEQHQEEPVKKATRQIQMRDIGGSIETTPPLTSEQKDLQGAELKNLYTTASGEGDGIYSDDLKRILNEGLKNDFQSAKLDVRFKTLKKRTYETTDGEEAPVNGTAETSQDKMVNGQAGPAETDGASRQGNQAGGFLGSLLGGCMGNLNNVKTQGSKLMQNLPKPKISPDTISLEAARSLIACFDFDRSGALNLPEFEALWLKLRVWRAIFLKHDVNKSGALSSVELRNALEEAGYSLDNDVLGCIVTRYSSRNGEVKFDDFLLCCARLKTSLDIYSAIKGNSQGNTITLEKSAYLTSVVYL